MESSVSSVCDHLRSHERASQGGCTASHSLWQGTRVPMAPHLLCPLSLSVPGSNHPGVTHGIRSLHRVAVLSPKLITAAV